MKKLLSAIMLLLILILVFWTVAGWYFGAASERVFKSLITDQQNAMGEQAIRIELLNFHRTLMGAKARLRIYSDIPVINNRLEELPLTVTLLNGPVFIDRSGLSFGQSQWIINLDEKTLSDVEKENIRGLFPQVLPEAFMVLDFADKLNYQITAIFNNVTTSAQGVISRVDQNHHGDIVLKDFYYELLTGETVEKVSAPEVKIAFQHQNRMSERETLRLISLSAPLLRIKRYKRKESVLVSLELKSLINYKNNKISGFFKSFINNKTTEIFPVESVKSTLDYKGLSTEGMMAFSKALAKQDNLWQQTQWVLEEQGAYPEGQDQLRSLYNKMDEIALSLPEIVAKKLFNAETTIELKSEIIYQDVPSRFVADIRARGIKPADIKVKQSSFLANKKAYFNPQDSGVLYSFLSYLEADIEVNLDKAAFNDFSDLIKADKPNFNFKLKGNKLLMQ